MPAPTRRKKPSCMKIWCGSTTSRQPTASDFPAQYRLDIKTLCQKKPDVDNLAKIVLDSLNKIAYDDDAQVCRLLVEKRYGETPQVLVRLSELEP